MTAIERRLDALLPPLLRAYGPPGREEPVRAVLRRAGRGLGRFSEDATGNLRLHVPGPGPRLLVAAHMDARGVIVTRVEGSGLARVALLGGTRAHELVGASVRFEDGLAGLIGWERPAAAKDSSLPEPDQLFLETGLSGRDAAKRLRTGSVAALEAEPTRLGTLWCSANLDNRAGLACVLAALKAARGARYDVHVAFTAQADLGARGATTGAHDVDPDLAIVVDVAFAEDGKETGVELGGGPCLGIKEPGFVVHPEALDLARRAASASRVKTQWLIREHEGSDARGVRGARAGVPTALIAIPARRTGGPASLIHGRDLAATAALLAKILSTPARGAKGGNR